jgi:hypothetical protein
MTRNFSNRDLDQISVANALESMLKNQAGAPGFKLSGAT